MSVLIWVTLFAATSLFWAWLVILGGAELLEESVISAFLIGIRGPTWSAEQIKAFGGLVWFAEGAWFITGLFVPAARFL